MIRRLYKRRLSMLTAAMMSASLIFSNITLTVHAATEEEPYMQDFEEGTEGWQKVHGGGVISHLEGGLNIEAANWPDQGEYTLVIDENSPEVQDGVYEVDVDVKSNAGRLGLVFRYEDEDNYNMIGYDVSGTWILRNVVDGNDTYETIATGATSLTAGQSYNLKVTFAGNNVEVKVNDQIVASSDKLKNVGKSGKIGIRQWGYTDNYSHANYDDLVYYAEKPSEEDENGNYLVSFDDNDLRGWSVKSGTGTMTVADGKMITEAGGNNANTISSDSKSPSIADGFIETTMSVNNHAGRVGILFRYEDPSNFAGIAYDTNGVWNWISGSGWGALPFTKELTQGEEYKVEVKYAGEYITILIDDEKVFAGTIPGIKTTAGKIGIRNWGYTGNFSSTTFDYFKNGIFNEVVLEPDYKFITYNDAGTYDVDVNMLGNNTLQSLKVGDEILTLNEDYVIDEDTVTIKKEFIEEVKEDGDTKISFLFEDGYSTTFTLQVQLPPDEAHEYLRDFSVDGIEGMTVVSGNGTVGLEDGRMDFAPNGTSIVIDENSPELFNSSVEFTVDPSNDNANIGAVLRYADEDSWTYIGQDGNGNQYGSSWYVQNSEGQRRRLVEDTARIYAKRVVPYKIKIEVVENTVTIYLDGAEIFHGVVPELTKSKGKAGVRLSNNDGLYQYLAINSEVLLETPDAEPVEREISSSDLTVKMDEKFPRVIDYTLDGKKMYGQEKPVYYVTVNNVDYVPEVTSTFTEGEAVYKLSIDEIGVSFDTRFEVVNNTLEMYIENIDESETRVNTINFPYHSLVSVRNTDAGAELNMANYASNDVKVDLTNKSNDEAYGNTSIAILSTDELAASIKNNSIKNVKEVNYQTFVVGDHYSTGLWTNEYLYRGIDGKVINEPWTKVTITADRNSDGEVNYEDGAIALRDDISPERLGVDLVNEAYTSVAMNVGSVAQYPFLRILDNVKKFNLATDGFEQTIIIKGYQGEGHDSSHPDFANISERAGGVEEFQTLLKESEKYNANIGVHINHTEAYPEAPQYGDVVSTVGGWSWYDSAKQIIRENDIMNEENGMAARLEDLFDIATGLDMVYIDVYMDGRWPAHKLTSTLNDNGIAVASEYAKSLTSTSVWAHHAYNGGYGTTSELARFVNHQEQDIFGGHNLFRGNSRIGINGWQGEDNLYSTLRNFYTSQLPYKYLMSFPVSSWDKTANVLTLGENNEVVSKMEDGKNVITKDGKKIAIGNKIFIPWNAETEEKIYHYNDGNGSTTWELPDSWAGLENVYLYELDDTGRSNEVSVPVVNGEVTLNVKANTGYVVYKGAQTQEEYSWDNGGHVADMGFDSHGFDYWSKTSTSDSTDHIKIVNNNLGNSHIRVEGNNGADATLTQTITGLTPGESYAANVWMEVSEGRKASITVSTGDGEEVTNYIDSSNVLYGHTHNDKQNTYYQNVEVKFVVPEGETTAILTLNAEEGADNSWVNIDDIRVMQSGITDKGEHYYFNDFENVTFGYGPFVSTKSDNSHLSQTNEPYTTDTIDGEFSMKIRSGDYMRTIPNTVRFKADTTYEVGLDYKAYNHNGFTASIKSDKAQKAGDTANATLGTVNLSGSGEVNKAVLEFTTGAYDDYYLEIRKNNGNEIILDNVYVDEIVTISLEQLQGLVNEAKALTSSEYTEESFAVVTEKLQSAEAVIAKGEASTEEKRLNAFNELKNAIDNLESFATEEDLTKLENTIEDMKALNSEDYKDDANWEALQNAILEAEALLEETEITVNEINNMVNKLLSAKEALTPANAADKSDLQELVQLAEAEVETDYVNNTAWMDFKQDIIEANAVISNANATQEEVDYRYNKLLESYNNLVPTNKANLEEAINNAKGYAEEDYTSETFAELQVQIDLAEAILADDEATRKEILDIIDALNVAIENLEEGSTGEVEVDKSKLQAVINKFDELDETKYIASTWVGYEKAVEAAKVVLGNEAATQEDVNTSYDSVLRAYLDLRLMPNKELLEDLLSKAENLNPEDYTVASFKAVNEAKIVAKAVLANEDATEKEIKNAEEGLVTAMANLASAEGETSKDDNKEEDKNSNLPQTGGTNTTVIVVACLAVVGAGGLLFYKKKDNNKKED